MWFEFISYLKWWIFFIIKLLHEIRLIFFLIFFNCEICFGRIFFLYFKVSILNFTSQLHPKHFIHWLDILEYIFDYKRINQIGIHQVERVCIHLVEDLKEKQKLIMSWEKMKKELNKRFLLTSGGLFYQFHNFKNINILI